MPIPDFGETSSYQLEPDGLGHGVRALADAELDLGFLQVAPDGLFTQTEQLRDVTHPLAGSQKTQNSEFARSKRGAIAQPLDGGSS